MTRGGPLIRTPDQRLRVFVSSTLQELAAERAAATEAVRNLKLTPVLFELGARPHPSRRLYRAYLEQSHVFVGIYGERYGWIAPGMEISGLEDEYLLSGDRPKLIYVKTPAPDREDRLRALLRRIEEHDRACYKTFSSPDELRTMLADDLAVMLSERFEAAAAQAGPWTAGRSDPAGAPRRLRTWRTGIGLAVVGAMMVVATWLARHETGPTMDAARNGSEHVAELSSIAVLPFVNMSGDPSQEYVSDGVSEELLNLLTRVPRLRVISRTSSFQFKGKNEDVRTIARRLDVAHVLEGSVRKAGNRIRVTAQLVSALDGSHEWSETYDRDVADLFAVQDEIAGRVVRELRLILLAGRMPDRVTPRSAETYSLLLQARYLLNRRTKDDAERAVGLATRAIALDENDGLAWSVLARARATQAGSGFLPTDEGVALARRAAERALALAPALADAHLIMGWILLSYDWNWPAADAEYRRALELEPGSAAVLTGAALLSRALGRFDESVDFCRRAVARDPLQAIAYSSLAISLMYAGRFAGAEEAARNATDLRPGAAGHWHLLSRVLLADGRPEEARAANEKEPDEGWRLMGRALVGHALGHAADSDAALATLTAKYSSEMPVQIAEVYAFRGEADAAFEWLERARALRDTGIAEIEGDPLLKRLERDPRYQAFLSRLGLPT